MANYIVYRYEFSPIIDSQINLFDGIDPSQVMAHKQDIFEKILNNENLEYKYNNKVCGHRYLLNENHLFIMQFANDKKFKIEKEFVVNEVDNQPSCYVIIDNRVGNQYIAIEEKSKAFSSPQSVANILQKVLPKYLKLYHLQINIKKMFQSSEFWSVVDEYKDKGIKMVRFTIPYPNLPNTAFDTLRQSLKKYGGKTNSQISTLELNGGDEPLVLDKNSKETNEFVSVSAQDGDEIILQPVGIKKHIHTGNTSVNMEIDNEIFKDGGNDLFKKLYDKVCEIFNKLKGKTH